MLMGAVGIHLLMLPHELCNRMESECRAYKHPGEAGAFQRRVLNAPS
jgi:hypothetical protein